MVAEFPGSDTRRAWLLTSLYAQMTEREFQCQRAPRLSGVGKGWRLYTSCQRGSAAAVTGFR